MYIHMYVYSSMYMGVFIRTPACIYTHISYMHIAKTLTIQLVAIISYLNKILVISQNIHSVFTYKTERGSQNYWTNRRIWL